MALESGKKVISLFVNHSNEGIIHSILKKKTICHTSIESVCNNIRKESSILTETDDAPIPNIADKLWIRQCRKVKKKRYILLIVIALFVICLLVPFYYTSSTNSVQRDECLPPPCPSENNIDSICVSETLGGIRFTYHLK